MVDGTTRHSPPATSSFVLHSPGTLHSMPRKRLYSWLDWKWAERQTKETMNDPQTVCRNVAQSLAHWKHNIKKGGDTQKATLHDAPRVLLSDQYDSWIQLFWNMSLCVGSELYVDVGDGAYISKPISETELNLVSDAKCMQWNFHQNPSISSKSQKNLQLFNSCSPWRWALVLGPLSVFWAIHTRRTDIVAPPLRSDRREIYRPARWGMMSYRPSSGCRDVYSGS